MYRIELKPGEENVFRTIEELATGIRNGLVTPKSRIFHGASQKWLPIEFHPHYKKALNMPPTKSGETPAVVVPSAPAPVSIFTPKPTPAPVFTPPPLAAVGPVALAPSPVAPAPAPVAPAPAKAPLLLAPAVVSPVVGLPTIAYDRPILENVPLPVAHAPLGRASAGRFRPLLLAIAAAVLMVGSYMALSAAAPSRKAPAAVAADTQAAKPATEQSSAPAPVAAAPNTSAPTFGPSAPSPIASKQPIVTSIGASPPAPAAKDSAVAIEPAPAEVDLSVPSLLPGESLAPAVKTDSSAMRRILRAVGGKGAPVPRP